MRGLKSNLISVPQITKQGYSITFHQDHATLTKDNQNVRIVKNAGMYIIPIQNATVATGLGARIKMKGTLTELHKLMGHRNNAILRAMDKQGNIKWTFTDESDDPCKSCIEAKAKIRSIPKIGKRMTIAVGELIHTDLCGPMRIKSIGGKSYFVTFIDDYSRFLMVYLLARKSEVIDALQMYYAFLNTQFKIKIKAIRSDGGGEYQGRFNFCKRMGIVQERTLPNSVEEIPYEKNSPLFPTLELFFSKRSKF